MRVIHTGMNTGRILRHAATLVLVGALGTAVWGLVRHEFDPYGGIALTLVILMVILDRYAAASETNTLLHEIRAGNGAAVEATLEKVSSDTSSLLTEQGSIKELVTANKETSERYVTPFFGATMADGNMRYFQQLKLGWSFRATSVQDHGSSIEVDRNDSIRLWRDSLIDSTTWDALSFAHDLWRDDERRISEAYQALQQELGGRNRIRRVFLVESHHDLDSIMPVLTMQVRMLGADNVRWMLRPDLMTLIERRGEHIRHSALLRDLDFAVVNESFVLWFVLNGRQLSRSKLTEVSQVVESAKHIFRMSFDNGQRLP
jgi:hypothetical protein